MSESKKRPDKSGNMAYDSGKSFQDVRVLEARAEKAEEQEAFLRKSVGVLLADLAKFHYECGANERLDGILQVSVEIAINEDLLGKADLPREVPCPICGHPMKETRVL